MGDMADYYLDSGPDDGIWSGKPAIKVRGGKMAIGKDEYEELCKIFIEIEESGIDLNEKSREFLAHMVRSFERYKLNMTISEPQWKWLRDLHRQAGK